ncbi:hypothetical protein P0Y31_09540 [Knoellia sp. 3-2P3]|uniref:hypothetical protein n=1 Tax=unclassified Knoellia TaxID=2618719 RepID=UPI0023DBCE82|nr:hypothetical protein [Knoellia sp. 3-2P3]MDF2092586.1 hypothetical protein [Knoellia sp. 3-2P3]
MTTLAVGRPYNTSRSHYPEGEGLRLTPSYCELVRFWPAPSPSEVAAHDGPASFAAVVASADLFLFGYKFGSLAWSDTPFQVGRLETHLQGVPAGEPEEPLHLRTVLVDATTGLVQTMRTDIFEGEFAAVVRTAVYMQLEKDFDDSAAGALLQQIYQHYRTPEELVAECAHAVVHVDRPEIGPVTAFHY